jgi:hypothetical protein
VKAPEGSRWHVFKRLIRATYGDSCVVCYHGGARQADHVIPVTERPDLAWDLRNLRMIHGVPGNRCFQCDPVKGIACNQIKGGGSVERARRIIAERTGKPVAAPSETPRETGREW